jgi:hypothetical protein
MYCHSLAIDDPFGDLLFRNSFGSRYEVDRAALLNYVNFLLHFAPLLRTHVLCMVTSEEYLPEVKLARDRGGAGNRTLFAQRLRQMVTDATLVRSLDFREIMYAAPADIQKHWQSTYLASTDGELDLAETNFRVACDRVGMAVGAAANSPGLLSIYFPFRYDVALLTAFEERVRAKEPVNVPDADNWLLNQWIDIELPGIASLTPDELVSIRTQSEEFEQWRRALKDAVRWADAAPRTLLDRRSHVKREVQERLEEGKNELESSMPKSTVLKGLKKGSVSMLGGAVSAALVFWLDPTRTLGAALAGLAGAAGSAAISAAEEGLKGSANSGKRATHAHYVAMLR